MYLKTAYRAQQVIIDSIKPGLPPMITLTIQKLELDENNNLLGISSREDRIYKRAVDIIDESIYLNDPITGFEGEVSIAGVEQILRLFANRWTAETYSCEIDPSTGWATNGDI